MSCLITKQSSIWITNDSIHCSRQSQLPKLAKSGTWHCHLQWQCTRSCVTYMIKKGTNGKRMSCSLLIGHIQIFKSIDFRTSGLWIWITFFYTHCRIIICEDIISQSQGSFAWGLGREGRADFLVSYTVFQTVILIYVIKRILIALWWPGSDEIKKRPFWPSGMMIGSKWLLSSWSVSLWDGQPYGFSLSDYNWKVMTKVSKIITPQDKVIFRGIASQWLGIL